MLIWLMLSFIRRHLHCHAHRDKCKSVETQGFHSLIPITPQIMNSNHTFICHSHHNKHHGRKARAGPCCWVQRRPLNISAGKYPEHARQLLIAPEPFDISAWQGRLWAFTLPTFLQHQPYSSQTHLAALLTHWKSHHVSTLAAERMLH